MKSLLVKLIENEKEIKGILEIKEDSFVINTNDNFITIPYTEFQSYDYDRDSKRLTIQAINLQVVLIIDYDIDLFQKLVELTEKNSKLTLGQQLKIGGIIGIIIITFLCVLMFLSELISNDNTDSDSDSDSCTTLYCRMAEDYALEDIPEMALVWDTVKINELICKAEVLTADQIALVRCNTSNSEIIKYFGSSEIWYGYIEAADGTSYFRYADSDQAVVLEKLRQ